MGSSYSSHRYHEDDGEGSQDGLEASSSDGAVDISPVVSEQDEAEEQEQSQFPIEACTSENLFRPSSSSVLPQGALQVQNVDASPWNMPQTERCGYQGNNTNSTPGGLNRAASIHQELNDDEEPSLLEGIAWQASAEVSPETCLEDVAQATCSFISSEVTGAILGEEWDTDEQALDADGRLLEGSTAGIVLSDYSRPTGIFFPWTPPRMSMPDASTRRLSDLSTMSEGDMSVIDFYPPISQKFEWMGRSIETLMLGHRSRAPVLALPDVDGVERTSGETSRRPEGTCTRRESVCSLDPHRSPHRAARRTSLSRGASYRRRSSCASAVGKNTSNAGPNILLSLLAREGTAKSTSQSHVPPMRRLREMGGASLYNAVDTPAGGMAAETALLKDALDRGDWTETQIINSRLAPRLIGDPSVDRSRNAIDDPSLPASVSRFYAGGGRLGLEREAFVSAGGVRLLLRIFTEPAFVGDEILQSNDARDLPDEMVNRKLASCWNEVFASLRELVYALPALVETGEVLDEGDFLPFLFTLLAHDNCFDGAAALIEEILSSQANSMQPSSTNGGNVADEDNGTGKRYVAPASTFFLGNVPDLYDLLAGFNCRQLAHFCRLLALLVFEPEDRQVLESPSVLRSVELLQLRRDRAARAGRDATVDMNQAILIGDDSLLERLLVLLRVMNFAPPLANSTPYHIMAYFPFVAGTLPMVGLNEISDFQEVDRLERLARTLLSPQESERLSDLGTVADMLESLSGSLRQDSLEATSQIGHIINVINAATQAGVVVGIPSQSRPVRRRGSENRGESVRQQDTSAASDSFASAAATLSNPALQQSLRSNESSNVEAGGVQVQVVSVGTEGIQVTGSPQRRINSPEDAANELQFNAFILAPYQVEVLFVLCTLLGGRRKIDSQNVLRNRGLISILDELFHRLSFESLRSDSSMHSSGDTTGSRNGNISDPSQPQEDAHGIHGPGCECTPESAMSVQFLRLLHNFCDRDCDNHFDRRLLLSAAERGFVFSSDGFLEPPPGLRPGLLSKVIQAFMCESDDSPYRFWLASCVESYLRGSCVQEQLFVAQSGLLIHLLGHVTSERIHCAGSLQTSFDLLGEICKGNIEVLRLLMSHLDELSFRRLMNVAASNLVDSNVFIRSLILSVERGTASQSFDEDSCLDVSQDSLAQWKSRVGISTRFYLTHSWWDPTRSDDDRVDNDEQSCDDARPSDWFPPFFLSPTPAVASYSYDPLACATTSSHEWIFPPGLVGGYAECGLDWTQNEAAEALAMFLGVNRTRLLQDLLRVVDLGNINHECICCLNTAVVLMIFSRRRGELREAIKDFKGIDGQRRRHLHRVDGTLIESIQSLAIDHDVDHDSAEGSVTDLPSSKEAAAVRNFRELLWFWSEYYSHRGRDRISIEFSSHMHFYEWENVVSILSADDGSSVSLVRKPIRLPRSPYQRAPRVIDTMDSLARGE